MTETLKLTGKPVADSLKSKISERIARLNERNITPGLRIIRVGKNEDDVFYEKSILKNCSSMGIKGSVVELAENISTKELVEAIESANESSDIHGIMLLRPLPKHLDQEAASRAINPDKDVDCMSPVNLEKIFTGRNAFYAPCTSRAVVEMLKYYELPLSGANITVAGRSLVVGKPLIMLLLNENATVTVCHSRTQNMEDITSKADVVVAAIGKAKFMGREYFKDSSVIIDVGINDDGSGKICGDVDYDNVVGTVKALSPAIGGIGSITTSILMEQTVKACEMLTS